MLRTCETCQKQYDDAERNTICPHSLIKSPEMQAQWEVGRELLGKMVRFGHMQPGQGWRVNSLTFDGMIGLEGWSDYVAPHLFVIDEVQS